MTGGGYEYNIVLIAAVLTLAETGPGRLSLDHALGIEREGPRSALFALALGAAGAVGAHLLAEATPVTSTEAAPEAAAEVADTGAPQPQPTS